MRQIQHAFPHGAIALRHAEVFEPEQRVASIEDTKHDRFAVDHRDDGNAQVDLAIGDLQPDAAVLRDALLGDVEMAENFDARNDRRVKSANLRRNNSLPAARIDAIAHAKLIFERLDVHIARPKLQGFDHELVDELDDGGVLGVDGEIEVVVFVVENFDAVVGFVERLECIGADTEYALGDALDVRHRRENGPKFDSAGDPQPVDRAGIKRIARGDFRKAIFFT